MICADLSSHTRRRSFCLHLLSLWWGCGCLGVPAAELSLSDHVSVQGKHRYKKSTVHWWRHFNETKLNLNLLRHLPLSFWPCTELKSGSWSWIVWHRQSNSDILPLIGLLTKQIRSLVSSVSYHLLRQWKNHPVIIWINALECSFSSLLIA